MHYGQKQKFSSAYFWPKQYMVFLCFGGVFYSTLFLSDSSTLLQVLVVCSFSLLFSILFCKYVIIYFTHAIIDGHSGYFQFWLLLNNASMNILVCIYKLRSRIAWSQGIGKFNFFRYCQRAFQSRISLAPVSSLGDFQFLYILAKPWYCQCFKC